MGDGDADETESSGGNSDSSDMDISTANTMRERANESRAKLWILLGANRLHVTAVIAVVFFVGFVVFGTLVYPPFRSTLSHSDVVETMFSTMLSAVITGTTLVVTISQLVISQENGPLGDQRGRMSDSMDFRDYTNELIGETTPADPSALLRKLVDTAESRANELNEAIRDGDYDDLTTRWTSSRTASRGTPRLSRTSSRARSSGRSTCCSPR